VDAGAGVELWVRECIRRGVRKEETMAKRNRQHGFEKFQKELKRKRKAKKKMERRQGKTDEENEGQKTSDTD
jgi:hypothetical protein